MGTACHQYFLGSAFSVPLGPWPAADRTTGLKRGRSARCPARAVNRHWIHGNPTTAPAPSRADAGRVLLRAERPDGPDVWRCHACSECSCRRQGDRGLQVAHLQLLPRVGGLPARIGLHLAKSAPTDDMAAVKAQYGGPQDASSCHTAVIDGYAVEGHVPVEAIEGSPTNRAAIDGRNRLRAPRRPRRARLACPASRKAPSRSSPLLMASPRPSAPTDTANCRPNEDPLMSQRVVSCSGSGGDDRIRTGE